MKFGLAAVLLLPLCHLSLGSSFENALYHLTTTMVDPRGPSPRRSYLHSEDIRTAKHVDLTDNFLWRVISWNVADAVTTKAPSATPGSKMSPRISRDMASVELVVKRALAADVGATPPGIVVLMLQECKISDQELDAMMFAKGYSFVDSHLQPQHQKISSASTRSVSQSKPISDPHILL